MTSLEAIREARRRAKREDYEMRVSWYPDHPSLNRDHKYITHRADESYARAELSYIITRDGKVHVAHLHMQQDGNGGRRWRGLKKDCPLCNPGKGRTDG